ncbi:Sodium/calcium exchanger protein-domain-containing protein [Tribonema minus]|uniref:Sodium/calcium exchanger protein-domain-containing protein n=1 Tax=Tribonema minus TaxID=303371 RepID=A0A835Z201_9STRA|nr:Sodium/calcium exchanger protein-domain-containing protein [Tribonema minus]
MLLVFLPLAQAAVSYAWGDLAIFILSFITMVPLAALVGDLTEAAAVHVGQTAGGLMNASFGNAPELVFAIQALRANEVRVVQASLLGSILSNLLLVLGSSFFAGGLFSGKKEQNFNRVSAGANTSLLMVSTLALFLPGHLAKYHEAFDAHVLLVSRTTAISMLLMYCQLMVFQFKTHAHVFYAGETSLEAAKAGCDVPLPLPRAIVGLAVTTALVAVFSDFLVRSIGGFTEATQLSTAFVGIVLIPIISNVVENIVAVTVAVRDKMELSMGIAVGSACQVSLFVIPTAVLIGWALDKDLTLNLPRLESYIYLLTVVIVSHMVGSGSSNWLLGSMLVTCYMLVALAFWYEKVLAYTTD